MTLSELFDKADELVEKRFAYSNATINEMNEYRDGYIHGMTEKLEGMVPVDKVMDWLCDNFTTREHDGDYNYGQEYVDCVFYNTSEMIDSFLKKVSE